MTAKRMTTEQYIDYLGMQPLAFALWHFIENMNEEDEGRTEVFFALRERVRRYQESPKTEQGYEKLWREANL